MVLHTRLSLREVGIRFRTNDVGRRKSIRLLCAFANWGEDEEWRHAALVAAADVDAIRVCVIDVSLQPRNLPIVSLNMLLRTVVRFRQTKQHNFYANK